MIRKYRSPDDPAYDYRVTCVTESGKTIPIFITRATDTRKHQERALYKGVVITQEHMLNVSTPGTLTVDDTKTLIRALQEAVALAEDGEKEFDA